MTTYLMAQILWMAEPFDLLKYHGTICCYITHYSPHQRVLPWSNSFKSSYTMLSWQLTKEVSIAVSTIFMWLASQSYVIDETHTELLVWQYPKGIGYNHVHHKALTKILL